MSDDEELRRNWRRNWLGCIQEFAHAETQRRTWLDHTNTNPHFSFVEYVCSYFDDLGLSDNGYAWPLEKGLVTPDEVEAVAEFHSLADTYDSPGGDDYDLAAILADPKWDEVVAAAQRAQSALGKLIDDPHELRLLMEP